jgi:predicted permease
LFRNERVERDLDEEVRAYAQMLADEKESKGLSTEEARREAAIELGGVEQVKVQVREVRTGVVLQTLLQDVRYAWRAMRKNPSFTAIAVLTLALGIGANTAIFTLLDQVLLRSFPVKDADQLVLLNWEGPVYSVNQGVDVLSYPMYRDIRDMNPVFSGVMARNRAFMGVSFKGQVERVSGEFVSGNYFEVLGVSAAAGRTISQDDDTLGARPMAVLSYDYWTTQFHADTGIVGTKIILNNVPFTIAGVSAKGFYGVEQGAAPKIRIPLATRNLMTPTAWTEMFGLESDGRWLTVFARLKDGVSREQAKAAMQPLFHVILDREVARTNARHPVAFTVEDSRKAWLNVLPASEAPSGPRAYYGNPLRVLMAMVGLVLLIACANVANLLLARAAGREREMAVRVALGAGAGRLIRQSLVESVMLAIAGGAAGMVIAIWADRLLLHLLPAENGPMLSARPDPRVLIFTLVIATFTGLLFGLAPALGSRKIDIGVALKEQARTMAGSHARFRRALAFTQVFLLALLLMGAGLFVRSLRNLKMVDPGFRQEHLIVFSVEPALNGYLPARKAALYRDGLEQLRGMPGVDGVGYNIIRLLDDWWGSPLTIEGYQPSANEPAWAVNNGVSPGYFATVGTPMIVGRDFLPGDGAARQKIAVVNETFVRRFFAGRSPIGRHLGYGVDPGTKADIEICGVVKDAKYSQLREETMPEVFVNAEQIADPMHANFYVRTNLPAESVFAAVRRTMTRVDPNLPIFGVRTMIEEVSENLSVPRMVATLALVFGGLAAFLAAIGLYGLLAFNVARRTREFGIRTALGAGPREVVWLVVQEVLVLAGCGIGLAIPASFALARLASSQIYGVGAVDPVSIIAAGILLATVACVAAYLPAARAVRIDPVRALRYE